MSMKIEADQLPKYGTFQTNSSAHEGTPPALLKTNEVFQFHGMSDSAYQKLNSDKKFYYITGGMMFAAGFTALIYSIYDMAVNKKVNEYATGSLTQTLTVVGLSLACLSRGVGIDSCLNSMEPLKIDSSGKIT